VHLHSSQQLEYHMRALPPALHHILLLCIQLRFIGAAHWLPLLLVGLTTDAQAS
jgi:hypothetical protein